ncbi:benenodin family lasso peptide [Luteimonas sp. BDR2-5]|nr:benenodin family lasso peptide [Luteimonas sp. BDR2-5]MCD9027841.1 benenodin family lasso peptide [Luteimonas sp. BDR2-5]
MGTNENTRTNASEDIIVLGVASVETKGTRQGNEPMGGRPVPGLSDE